MLASSLLKDGIPWWSIAVSFLGGAVKERANRRPSLRFGSALAAITIGTVAVPLALFGSLTTAGASSTTITITISKPANAVRQLESALASHHFNIAIIERPVSMGQVGSILSVNSVGPSTDNASAIKVIQGRCNDGTTGCIDGLVLPRHYSGSALVTVGVQTPSHKVHKPATRE